jgi:hypothetical protein
MANTLDTTPKLDLLSHIVNSDLGPSKVDKHNVGELFALPAQAPDGCWSAHANGDTLRAPLYRSLLGIHHLVATGTSDDK